MTENAALYALVRIEECCNHFDAVLAVGTQGEMEAKMRSHPDRHVDDGYAVIVAEVKGE